MGRQRQDTGGRGTHGALPGAGTRLPPTSSSPDRACYSSPRGLNRRRRQGPLPAWMAKRPGESSLSSKPSTRAISTPGATGVRPAGLFRTCAAGAIPTTSAESQSDWRPRSRLHPRERSTIGAASTRPHRSEPERLANSLLVLWQRASRRRAPPGPAGLPKSSSSELPPTRARHGSPAGAGRGT